MSNIASLKAAGVDLGRKGVVVDGVNDPSDQNTDTTNDSDDIYAAHQTITVDPGGTLTYPVQVANTGGSSDSFDLILTNNAGGDVPHLIAFYSDPTCDGLTADDAEITNTGLLGGTSIRVDDADCTNSTTLLCVYDTSNFTATAPIDELIVGTDGVSRTVSAVSVSARSITLVAGDALAGAAGAGTSVAEVICVNTTVSVPADTAASSQNLIIKATSPLSAKTDNMDVAITVNEVCAITHAPDGSDQLPAGGTTTYTHTISNDGNYDIDPTVTGDVTGLALSYAFLADIGAGVQLFDPTTGFAVPTMTSGTTFTYEVRVQAPTTVPPGTVESFVVKADQAGGCLGEITDTTTVIEGYLLLTKSVDKATAFPADTLQYRVQYKNIGAQDATEVVITDDIPGYTTYSTNSLCVDTACTHTDKCLPADGGAGTALGDGTGDADTAEFVTDLVRFRVGTGANATVGGTVAPGETGCVYFKVIVD